MKNVIKALKWRICGRWNPDEPVTEAGPVRARNRAKYEVWKYNTFGPGRGIYGSEYAYEIVDAPELRHKPLHINDPIWRAGMASIIAEIAGNRRADTGAPLSIILTEEDETCQQDEAIYRVVKYLVPDNLGPLQYTEWREGEVMGGIRQVPTTHIIEPDMPRGRENLGRIFRGMLGKLKAHYSS